MESLKDKIFYYLGGVFSGLTGLFSLSRCSTGICTSCFGCAGAGIGILLIGVIKKLRDRRKHNAVA